MCRGNGISSAMFYKWKSNSGGLEVSDVRRLLQQEQENERLKKLLAKFPGAPECPTHWMPPPDPPK